MHPRITALFQPYDISIYFLFPRLRGEFLESNNLRGKRMQWSAGRVLEPHTLGANPGSSYPPTRSWVSFLRVRHLRLLICVTDKGGITLRGVGWVRQLRTATTSASADQEK